jgi:hypothetical protein
MKGRGERERERDQKGLQWSMRKIGSECMQREDRELLFFSGGDMYHNTRSTSGSAEGGGLGDLETLTAPSVV